MMFSVNHLRHSGSFSARSFGSMMICFFHCAADVKTAGSLAISGSS